MRAAVEDIECDLELLGLTGVEDKLQENVNSTLATLRDAGVVIHVSRCPNVWVCMACRSDAHEHAGMRVCAHSRAYYAHARAHAGVRVWMLTGDKVETAKCIATSSNLFARNAPVFR